MQLFINPRSGVPIYMQIMQQFEKGIAGGILAPGEQLPPVRDIALQLTINPNTVARAYRELEQQGLLESKQGKGTFVARSAKPLQTKEIETIFRKQLASLIREARQLGIASSVIALIFQEELTALKEDEKVNG